MNAKRAVVMFGLVVAAACANDTAACRASMLDDPRWRALVVEMNLPDYSHQRLEMYVKTLDDSRCILARADDAVRASALQSLDDEMGQALPLLVPASFTEKVHAYLRDALSKR